MVVDQIVSFLTLKCLNVLILKGMSKFNLSKFLKILSYINEAFKFLFPFIQKIDREKKVKDSSNVEKNNN